MFDLSRINLTAYFNQQTLKRGKEYAENGRVTGLHIFHEGNTLGILAEVMGSSQELYRTGLFIDGDNQTIDTQCTCPMSVLCKHAVAVFLTFIQQAQNTTQPTHSDVLHDGLIRWIRDTEKCLKTRDATPLTDTTTHLAFILEPNQRNQNILTIQLGFITPLKNGGWSVLKKMRLDSSNLRTNDKLTREQFILIETLKAILKKDCYYENSLNFDGKALHEALSLIFSTSEQCFWLTSKSTPLTQGDEKAVLLTWATQADHSEKIQFYTEDPADIIIPAEPMWYINPVTHKIGRLTSSLPDALTTQLACLPPIPATQLQKFNESFEKIIPKTLPVPKLKPLDIIHVTDIPPQLILKIILRTVTARQVVSKREVNMQPRRAILAQCFVAYDHHETNPAINHTDVISVKKDNALYQYQRDIETEIATYKKLEQIDLKELDEVDAIEDSIQHKPEFQLCFFIGFIDDLDAMNHFQHHLKPQIEAAGWTLSYEQDVPIYDFVEPQEWYTELNESSDYDWFTMQLGIVVNDQRIDLLPILLQSIKTAKPIVTKNNETILKISENKSIKIPTDRMQRILNVLTHLIDVQKIKPGDALKIERHKLALLAEMEKAFNKAQLRWLGNQQLLELSKKLSNFKTLKKTKISKDFQAQLRPYQHVGVDWLQFLRDYSLNGILADDMGLGKTVQILAHLATEHHHKRLTQPVLIVAPTSVLINWKHEIQRFTPHLSTLMLHGNNRSLKFDDIPKHHIVLTSYALLTRDHEQLIQYNYYYLILDESHYIKNKQAKKTQIVQQLNAQHRLCLTGTPLENHLGELWSQFNFLMPGLLGSAKHFKESYQTPIEKNHNKEKQTILAQLTKPFLLRRTKQLVVQDLPEKTDIVKYVEMEKEQRDLYESIRLAMDKKVRKAIDEKGIERSQIIILDALLKLRQACCDPRLLSLPEAQKIEESAKLDLLMNMIPELIEEQRKILLFSQFTGMLALIEERVKKLGVDYVKLTGSTTNREKPIHQFQHGTTPLFLISLKAGGVGLNLTAADTVIHYDPWWNPAVEQQATDRAHRIGQKNAVFVYKLITSNTIEEKIILMQEQKKALANALFDNKNHAGKLKKTDLEQLFACAK